MWRLIAHQLFVKLHKSEWCAKPLLEIMFFFFYSAEFGKHSWWESGDLSQTLHLVQNASPRSTICQQSSRELCWAERSWQPGGCFHVVLQNQWNALTCSLIQCRQRKLRGVISHRPSSDSTEVYRAEGFYMCADTTESFPVDGAGIAAAGHPRLFFCFCWAN